MMERLVSEAWTGWTIVVRRIRSSQPGVWTVFCEHILKHLLCGKQYIYDWIPPALQLKSARQSHQEKDTAANVQYRERRFIGIQQKH